MAVEDRHGFSVGELLPAGCVVSLVDRAVFLLEDGGVLAAAPVEEKDSVHRSDEDARTLGVTFDESGVREGIFPDLVKLLHQEEFSDWRIAGPRTTQWLLKQLVASGMTPVQRHYWWRNTVGLTPSDNGVDEHLFLSELLEWGLTYDFLGLGNLLIAEHVSRRYQLWEEVYSHVLLEQQVGSGSAEWVDERRIFLGQTHARGSALVSPDLQSYVASEMASRSAILKERRKGREERRLAKGGELEGAPAAAHADEGGASKAPRGRGRGRGR